MRLTSSQKLTANVRRSGPASKDREGLKTNRIGRSGVHRLNETVSHCIVASFVVALVVAVPQRPQARGNFGGGGDDAGAEIVNQDTVINADGSYTYNYETSNGISASQASNDGTNANGNFAYTAPDGQRIEVVYVADENGFQPQGAHLPTEPPAPEHVIRMLEEMRANPPEGADLESLDATLNRLRATLG
ncbi:AGAP005451-PA-like protein [Anopheles sinensis]|uniref:AGAP005451-PA-like protein n=1 Tax=Anopheles sinensis TaxID=74873 RepID=A0A084VDK6_ANOSI|nr:AGAP005451-PA-like protein [Anopheles sinensis]